MDGTAKLIIALAALLSAVAWPLVWAIALIAFRKEVRSSFSRVPAFLDRLRKFKGAGMEAELDAVADKVYSNGEVTAEQTRAAVQLAAESREHGSVNMYAELDKLCLQYDTVRRTMRPGGERTREMTRIVAKMRALGLSTSSEIDIYKGSGSAGSRLAAVAMMQMEPKYVDLAWLLDRFRAEAPFIFYHAALALTNAANSRSDRDRAEVLEIAQIALDTVRSFKGVPDRETVNVLESLVPPQVG